MTRLRMTQPGYENFTGDFGVVTFLNGVSVDDVGVGEARRLSGIIQMEDAETGVNHSFAQVVLDRRDVEMKISTLPEAAADVPTPGVVVIYSDAQLAAIADKGGIKGIRAISDPLNLKGTSISVLIAAILKAQPKADAATAPSAPAEPVAAVVDPVKSAEEQASDDAEITTVV